MRYGTKEASGETTAHFRMSAMGRKRTLAECLEWVESGHSCYGLGVRRQGPSTKSLFASVIALFIGGCGSGEHPFLQVQFCLTDTAGPADLKRTIHDIARDEGMKFTDRSAEAEAELRAIGNLPAQVERSFPLIMVSARRSDVGFSASNAGLGANQVVVGFSRNNAKAHAFAKRAVQRLEQQWDLVRVPNDRGALPLQDCPTG